MSNPKVGGVWRFAFALLYEYRDSDAGGGAKTAKASVDRSRRGPTVLTGWLGFFRFYKAKAVLGGMIPNEAAVHPFIPRGFRRRSLQRRT